uniref:HTH CENPB-type domain-containing protein n=1 Tax=Esox lucius TaxID=8010 RepID=A0A3P8X9Q7_ESOLU
MSVHLLSRACGVPRSTLQRRISGKVTGSERKPYLPEEAERELAATLKTLAQRGFPFTKRDYQQAAFDFAAKNNISGRAGYYWFQNFLKSNPELGMRKPEVLQGSGGQGCSLSIKIFSLRLLLPPARPPKDCYHPLYHPRPQDHSLSHPHPLDHGRPC